MFLKPKHFILECRPNFGSFCPLPGPLRAIVFSAPKPPLSQISAYVTARISSFFLMFVIKSQTLQSLESLIMIFDAEQ